MAFLGLPMITLVLATTRPESRRRLAGGHRLESGPHEQQHAGGGGGRGPTAAGGPRGGVPHERPRRVIDGFGAARVVELTTRLSGMPVAG